MSKILIEGQKPKKEESRLDEFPDLGLDAVKGAVEPLENGIKDARKNLDDSMDWGREKLEKIITEIFKSQTKARIYIHLMMNGQCTSDKVAKGANLYPSTVREALLSMYEEGYVSREKEAHHGAGKNPYVYKAVNPLNIIRGYISGVEKKVTALMNIENILNRGSIKLPLLPITLNIGGEEDEGKEGEGSGDGEKEEVDGE
jgi:predicted transcriptional regulator